MQACKRRNELRDYKQISFRTLPLSERPPGRDLRCRLLRKNRLNCIGLLSEPGFSGFPDFQDYTYQAFPITRPTDCIQPCPATNYKRIS